MSVQHPAWSAHAAIYQVNLRQFTPEGTLAAFESHLPRIADLMGGSGIVWFMPVQPIGAEQRKGTMGSYYSVRDYTAVNPEFGTLDDFKRVVARAHALGLKVIIDWVANHTAWDHAWTREHPQWYLKDAQGRIHSYVYRANPGAEPEYWTDVVGLDWSQPGLWDAMDEAMLFWMRETDIDGFRCDVAALVPIEYWERLRPQLDAIKPVFMLAEAHEPVHHRAAFDATYDWDLLDQFKAIAKGAAALPALKGWWVRRCAHYGPDDHRMIYTANHDSNSWHGSCAELFGAPDAADGGMEAFAVMATLAALLPGQPLIYGGQEGYFRKRLAFFEKDPIDWAGMPLHGFYRELISIKSRYPALANDGTDTGFTWLDTGNEQVLAFARQRGSSQVAVAVNFSSVAQAWVPPPGPWSWRLLSAPVQAQPSAGLAGSAGAWPVSAPASAQASSASWQLSLPPHGRALATC